jgi:hypothetical protein
MSTTMLSVIDKPLSKTDIEGIVNHLLEKVNEGSLNSLQVAIVMNSIEYLTKSVKERIQLDVINELYKYPKNKAEINGATVSAMDLVKYDYSSVGGWQELEDQIIILKQKQKELEENEKKYHRGDLPIKSATSTFKVQLAK